jgi:hypothetical protein
MPFPPSLSTTHYRWLAVLWTVGIVAACSIPAASLTPLGPALSADKAIHVGLFAGFGALWMRALVPLSEGGWGMFRQQALRVLVGGSFLAVGTEVYQHVLPLQRLGDPYDALANGAGLLGAVIGYGMLLRIRTQPDHTEPVN